MLGQRDPALLTQEQPEAAPREAAQGRGHDACYGAESASRETRRGLESSQLQGRDRDRREAPARPTAAPRVAEARRGGDGGERHREGSQAGQHLQPGRSEETATVRRPDPRVSPEQR